MKERSKERIAELLMEELLDRLAERGNIKNMLADMTPLSVDELIDGLLDEFERVIEQRHRQVLESVKTKRERSGVLKENIPQPPAPDVLSRSVSTEPPAVEPPKSAATIPTPQQPVPLPPPPKLKKPEPERPPDIAPPSPEISVEPLRLIVSPIEVKLPPIPEPPAKPVPPPPELRPKKEAEPSDLSKRIEEIISKKSEPSADKVDEIIRKMQPSIEQRKKAEEEKQAKLIVPVPQPPVKENVPLEEKEVESEAEEPEFSAQKRGAPKISQPFTDDDLVYVHAAAGIPEGEEASPEPFMLEEKGIDPRSFAFALDYQGMRFYLSKILTGVMNVSKTGVLLLGKQESLQLQGNHESVLNNLRGHGVLLPFKFGTIARGKDELLGYIDKHVDRLKESLEALRETSWWTVSLFVLDSNIAQMVGKEESIGHRERGNERESSIKIVQTKKYDIKILERMLNREKKLAESVHEELDQVAERSDIDMMVGLGSGSSEDWKLIFKASYEITPVSMQQFNRAITDLQYHYMLYDPMIRLEGDAEYYSFKDE